MVKNTSRAYDGFDSLDGYAVGGFAGVKAGIDNGFSGHRVQSTPGECLRAQRHYPNRGLRDSEGNDIRVALAHADGGIPIAILEVEGVGPGSITPVLRLRSHQHRLGAEQGDPTDRIDVRDVHALFFSHRRLTFHHGRKIRNFLPRKRARGIPHFARHVLAHSPQITTQQKRPVSQYAAGGLSAIFEISFDTIDLFYRRELLCHMHSVLSDGILTYSSQP